MSKRIILFKKDKSFKKEEQNHRQIFENFKKYKNYLFIFLILPVSIIIYFFFMKPRFLLSNNLAHKEMYDAIYSFKNKNYQDALEGTKDFKGFIEISKKFRWTKAAQIANFYIGYINLNKGNYDDAIKNLKKFKINDFLIKAKTMSLIGDAYSQKKEYEKAISYYKKAANLSDNKIYSPKYLLKAAHIYEKLNDSKSAIQIYKKILTKYSKSSEVQLSKKMIYVLEK